MREQTERILEDPLFRNSKRYTDLLRFIVDRTLLGQIDDLHERIIGIEVFGRPPNYDTSADPTVRVTATEIRKRLALYYVGPDREHELRIDLPVRSYVAEFRSNKPHPEEPTDPPLAEPVLLPPQPPAAEPAPPPSRRLWYLAIPIALAVLLSLAWLLHRSFARPSALDAFWMPLVQDQGPVLICIGVSARHPGPAQPGPSPPGPINQQPDGLPPQRGLVPMLDVNSAIAVSSLLQHKSKEANVVPADGTGLSDLRDAPAVLIGSYDNEWTLRLGADLPYRFNREAIGGSRWIEVAANPASHTWGFDIFVPQSDRAADYALVTRVFDPTTGHWWIGIGGLSGLGTSAAQQVITDPASFSRLSAQFPRDWSRKNLQFVLAVKAVHGSPGAPQLVASQSW